MSNESETIKEVTKIAVTLAESPKLNLTVQEQALFIAAFQEGVKWYGKYANIQVSKTGIEIINEAIKDEADHDILMLLKHIRSQFEDLGKKLKK